MGLIMPIPRLLHSHTVIDNPQETMLFIFFAWLFLAIVMSVLAYAFPFKDGEGNFRPLLSVLVAVVFFPAYIVYVAIQNPLMDYGNKNYLFTFLVLFIFWPMYFALAPREFWDNYQTAKVSGV